MADHAFGHTSHIEERGPAFSPLVTTSVALARRPSLARPLTNRGNPSQRVFGTPASSSAPLGISKPPGDARTTLLLNCDSGRGKVHFVPAAATAAPGTTKYPRDLNFALSNHRLSSALPTDARKCLIRAPRSVWLGVGALVGVVAVVSDSD